MDTLEVHFNKDTKLVIITIGRGATLSLTVSNARELAADLMKATSSE